MLSILFYLCILTVISFWYSKVLGSAVDVGNIWYSHFCVLDIVLSICCLTWWPSCRADTRYSADRLPLRHSLSVFYSDTITVMTGYSLLTIAIHSILSSAVTNLKYGIIVVVMSLLCIYSIIIAVISIVQSIPDLLSLTIQKPILFWWLCIDSIEARVKSGIHLFSIYYLRLICWEVRWWTVVIDPDRWSMPFDDDADRWCSGGDSSVLAILWWWQIVAIPPACQAGWFDDVNVLVGSAVWRFAFVRLLFAARRFVPAGLPAVRRTLSQLFVRYRCCKRHDVVAGVSAVFIGQYSRLLLPASSAATCRDASPAATTDGNVPVTLASAGDNIAVLDTVRVVPWLQRTWFITRFAVQQRAAGT